MYCEQLLIGDFGYYHQDKNGWLNWCKTNRARLFTEYYRRLCQGESIQDFFGDWCSFEGHCDVGYFLGCEFVKALVKEFNLPEITGLSCEVLEEQFAHYAGQQL